MVVISNLICEHRATSQKLKQMIYQAIESEIFFNILLHRLFGKQTTKQKHEWIFLL